jgi:arsenate reductase
LSNTDQAHPGVTRVLFVCTQNSARSQIAEALLVHRGGARFHAASAGSQPAERVNPGAVEILREHGIDWSSRVPKSIGDVIDEPWDLVVTVCDRARDACPVFPRATLAAHWGTADPAAVEGDEARRAAFGAAVAFLEGKVRQLVSLSDEQLRPPELERTVRAIA